MGSSNFGVWRSLVAYLVWDQGVQGSNPCTPTNNMIIIDNAFSESMFKKIQEEILGFGFDWHYGRRVNEDDGSNENSFLIGWVHVVAGWESEQKFTPELYSLIESELSKVLTNNNEPCGEIIRVRIVCNTTADKSYITQPHVDCDYTHQTVLFYINDADGDTIIYNEKFKPGLGIESVQLCRAIKHKLTIKAEIKPKANRLVIFNGLHYHSGTTPTESDRRVVMNINYKLT